VLSSIDLQNLVNSSEEGSELSITVDTISIFSKQTLNYKKEFSLNPSIIQNCIF
jgi:hypothetical protein